MLAKGGGVVDGRLAGVLMGRLWRAVVLAVAVATAVAGFTLVVPRAPARAEVSIPAPAASGTNVAVLSGDFTGDGKTDLAVSGSQYFTSVPVAASAGDGSFTSTAAGGLGDFAGWASVPGVRQVTGDFNGDGKTDIALVPPPGTPWWYTLPVAMSHGDGSFTVTNTAAVGDFTSDWAQTAGARVVSGDFNGDGKTDIALLGAPGWTSIPIAYSNGDGSFGVVTAGLSNTGFAGWDSVAGVRVLTGDYNGDGRTDIALVPPANTPWWYTLPVAFATASGSFMVTNTTGMGNFTAAWAQQPGVRALAGDFNGDHKTDIALTGGSGWNSVPVALSNGDGTFMVVNQPSLPDFGAWAHQATNGVLGCVYAGDYNGDGRTDIALPCVITSAGNLFTVPVAFADGHGGFTVTNQLVPPDFGTRPAARPPGSSPVTSTATASRPRPRRPHPGHRRPGRAAGGVLRRRRVIQCDHRAGARLRALPRRRARPAV